MKNKSGPTETVPYRIHATRDGEWWYFRIPELETSGQARTLEEVAHEARAIIAMWLRADESEIKVEVSCYE